MQRLVNVYRGEHLESFHSGSIAVVDAAGRLLALAGNPSEKTFIRSSAKPFQAIALIEQGGAEEFDLTGEEIALICASHGGEPQHVAAAAAILRKGDFDESDLLCGIHPPYDEKAAAELRLSGEPASVLQNNCSGNHAGMLLTTQLMDVPSAGYIERDHPLQRTFRNHLAEFADLGSEQIDLGIDGCGAPSYLMSIYRAALAYARLAETCDAPESPSSLPRFHEAARLITEAMVEHPAYVGGRWTMTTPLMESFSGELLAKEGAEGFYAMALRGELAERVRQRLSMSPGSSAIGIALKIHDGSMERGRNQAILRTLELLGSEIGEFPRLKSYVDSELRNASGTLVGEVRAEFDLSYL